MPPEGSLRDATSAFDIIQQERAAGKDNPASRKPNNNSSIPYTARLRGTVWTYLRKYRGSQEGLFPPKPSLSILFWSWLASFIGISLCAVLTYTVHISTDGQIDGEPIHLTFLIGSFGASAVLIYGTLDSPLAQPRNFLGGSLVSACVGVGVAEAFEAGGYAYARNTSLLWLECALAVSLAITAMQYLRVVHPPGGATALIAVTSPPAVRLHGLYIVIPVALGITLMLAVALAVNNIARQYPYYWWKPKFKDIPIREGSTHHSSRRYGEAFGLADENFGGAHVPREGDATYLNIIGPNCNGGLDGSRHGTRRVGHANPDNSTPSSNSIDGVLNYFGGANNSNKGRNDEGGARGVDVADALAKACERIALLEKENKELRQGMK